MAQVLIVYATDYGNTKKMAETVAAGAREVAGTEVLVVTAEEATSEQVIACDALVLGSPVHMACMDWRMKKFIDTICGKLWMEDKMVGRVGAVFVTGGGFGNAGMGCETTMIAMLNNLAELGLIIISLPKSTPGFAKGGLQWGPYGRSMTEELTPIEGGVPEERLEAAKQHGMYIARAAAALKGAGIFDA